MQRFSDQPTVHSSIILFGKKRKMKDYQRKALKDRDNAQNVFLQNVVFNDWSDLACKNAPPKLLLS